MYMLKPMAHVEACCRAQLAMSWLCGPLLMCLSREPLRICFHIQEPHLVSRPCKSSWTHKPCVLEIAHPSWQAAHEDHSHRVVANRPSDGPIVVDSSHKCLLRPSCSCWLALVCGVCWGHAIAFRPCCSYISPAVHLDCVSHVSSVHHAIRLTRISLEGQTSCPWPCVSSLRAQALCIGGNPPEPVGGQRGPFWKVVAEQLSGSIVLVPGPCAPRAASCRWPLAGISPGGPLGPHVCVWAFGPTCQCHMLLAMS